jgi:hypothetical protein
MEEKREKVLSEVTNQGSFPGEHSMSKVADIIVFDPSSPIHTRCVEVGLCDL